MATTPECDAASSFKELPHFPEHSGLAYAGFARDFYEFASLLADFLHHGLETSQLLVASDNAWGAQKRPVCDNRR
jgi:hypothetical protein